MHLVTLSVPGTGRNIPHRACIFKVLSRNDSGTPQTLELVPELSSISLDEVGDMVLGYLPEEVINDL